MSERKPSEKPLSAADRKLMQSAHSVISSFYDSSEDKADNQIMQETGRVLKRLARRLGHD